MFFPFSYCTGRAKDPLFSMRRTVQRFLMSDGAIFRAVQKSVAAEVDTRIDLSPTS